MKRKVFKGTSPAQVSQRAGESGSASKRREVQKKVKVFSRENRNKISKSQKVLPERIFDPKIFNQPEMVELVKFVKYQDQMHLFEIQSPQSVKRKSGTSLTP